MSHGNCLLMIVPHTSRAKGATKHFNFLTFLDTNGEMVATWYKTFQKGSMPGCSAVTLLLVARCRSDDLSKVMACCFSMIGPSVVAWTRSKMTDLPPSSPNLMYFSLQSVWQAFLIV